MNENETLTVEDYYNLPKRYQWCSHTLSLQLIKLNTSYGKCHVSVMNKCSNLWNKTNRSANKASKEYKNIVGRAFCTPCITRWNSYHDSFSELLRIQELLLNICQKLEISHFNTQDLQFLEEYKNCTEPIAYCLNMLQSEKEIFFGDILPWIHEVKHNLECVNQNKTLKYCEPLKEYLLKRLYDRFRNIFEMNDDAEDYIIATICHPK